MTDFFKIKELENRIEELEARMDDLFERVCVEDNGTPTIEDNGSFFQDGIIS